MTKFAKGVFLLTIAHLFFMSSGYLIQVLLGRYFPPSIYGAFGIIIAFLNICSTLTVSGVNQAMTKLVAATPEASRAIIKFVIKFEFLVGVVSTTVIYLLVEPIAIFFFADTTLIFPLRIVVFILPFYIFRSVFGGFLLGMRQYLQTSLLSFLSGIIKLLVVGLAVFLGYQLIGVLMGYLTAALSGLCLGIWLTFMQKLKGKDSDFDKRQFLRWSLLLTALGFMVPFFQNMSIFLLKYLQISPEKVGFFNAAVTFSNLPYILSVGLAGAILPAASLAFSRKKLKSVSDQLTNALRYSFLFLLPLVTVLALTSKAVIPIVFSERYSQATFSFSILLFGFFFFALYNILNSVLIALGKGKEILFYSIMFILVNLLLNRVLIPLYGINGAAIASFISFFLASFVFIIIASLDLGAFWLKSWLVKIPFASFFVGALVYGVFSFIPSRNLLGLISLYIFSAAIYLGILIFLKEISKKDFEQIKDLLFLR